MDENVEIELFEWAAVAARDVHDVKGELIKAKASASSHQEHAAMLQRQLDEFIQAKEESELQMLEKFRLLLNAKKLKIRDQQRLLARAKVDPRAGNDSL